MNVDNNAWLTLYQDEFSQNKYLYHFTSIEKAASILDSDSLKFSKITKTNDTLEAKPKMSSKNISSNSELKRIFDRINQINHNYIQLLCFTTDNENVGQVRNGDANLSDYSGRGFALPRMWAQYAHNNDGVCFVFDKEQLLKLVKKELRTNIISKNKIIYVSQYTPFDFDYETMLNFLIQEQSEFSNAYEFAEFLKKNKEYTMYNYFYKLNDWENENEFRILAYGDKTFVVNKIHEALVGVVIGEQIRSTDEKIIKYFCNDICEVKKIDFSYHGCTLENIR